MRLFPRRDPEDEPAEDQPAPGVLAARRNRRRPARRPVDALSHRRTGGSRFGPHLERREVVVSERQRDATRSRAARKGLLRAATSRQHPGRPTPDKHCPFGVTTMKLLIFLTVLIACVVAPLHAQT